MTENKAEERRCLERVTEAYFMYFNYIGISIILFMYFTYHTKIEKLIVVLCLFYR